MNLLKKPFSKFILWYLKNLAKLRLKRINPIVIGVGGSSGKSSLANLINIILLSKYKVRFNEGKNSESGIPLNILGIELKNYSLLSWLKIMLVALFKLFFDSNKYQVYIAEMGIDSPFEPKNMSYLLKIIKPKIAVLTNISHEHSEYFDSLVLDEDLEKRKEKILDLTAKEELLLLNTLSRDCTAILNIDDLKIKNELGKISANKITVSDKSSLADVFISKVEINLNNFVLYLSFEKKEHKLKINMPLPIHFAKTFSLAIATSLVLGVKIEDAILRIEKHFSLPPGRLSVFEGVKETMIIDSSYNNATLQPLLDVLDLTKTISGKRRKFAILGDLRELGLLSEFMHQKAAEKIIQTVDFAVLIGPLMQKYAEPILAKKKFPYKSFLTFSEARYFILTNIKKKDLIIVKGSQNTLLLERAVEMLLKNSKDNEKLCRRGKYWDEIRQKTS